MGQHGHSEVCEVIVISRRERGGHRGCHQYCHLETDLRRWSHDDAQQRQSMVLRWRDGFKCEEDILEPGWVRWIMWCSRCTFYSVVGQRKVDDHGEGGSGGGTSMTPVT
jgi:hypothetical protein